MLVAQQLKHLHGLEFAFLLALSLRLLVKFWGCKGKLLLWDVNSCTDTLTTMGKGESHESKPSTACTLSLVTGVQHNCASNFIVPTGKSPQATQNRFNLSCTQFH